VSGASGARPLPSSTWVLNPGGTPQLGSKVEKMSLDASGWMPTGTPVTSVKTFGVTGPGPLTDPRLTEK